MLAAVRCMAILVGDTQISLRIAVMDEECARCLRVSKMFIEPARVCPVCWSILAMNSKLDGLSKKRWRFGEH